ATAMPGATCRMSHPGGRARRARRWCREPSEAPRRTAPSRLALGFRTAIRRLPLRNALDRGASRPGHGLGEIIVVEVKLGELCPDRVGPLDADGGEHDLSGPDRDLEVLRVAGGFDGG